LSFLLHWRIHVAKRHKESHHDTALPARFGVVVRGYRRRLGLSQEELAWRADMHRTYLADIERGRRNISLLRIARLIAALEVSLGRFFATLERKLPSAPVSRSRPAGGGPEGKTPGPKVKKVRAASTLRPRLVP
jgi:DNA-binding XRE family transcriptional regulator